MRARHLIVLTALIAVLSACEQPRSTVPFSPGPPVAAVLTSVFTATPTSMTWTYRVRNDERADLAVFTGDLVEDGDDGGTSAMAGAWVVPRDERTVEVSHRLLAPPDRVGLARPYVQWGTVIPAGATISGSATVPLPLRPAHPYDFAFEPPFRISESAESVVFCVGVARAADMPPRPADVAGRPLYLRPDGDAPKGARKARYVHGVSTSQHLVCAPPERLSPG